jgi:hypothetical protein
MKLNLKEGSCPVKDLAHFLQEFRATAAKFAAIGAGISEADQASALLSTLPDSLSPLIMSLSSTTTDPGLSHVTTMIEQEVMRRKEEKRGITPTQTSFNTALAVTKTSRSRGKNKCNVSTRSTYQAGVKKCCIGCEKENHFWVHCFHNPDRVGISSQRTTDRKTPYGSAQLRIRHDQAPPRVNRARSLTLKSDAESSGKEREDFFLNRQDPGKARHTIADQSARSDKSLIILDSGATENYFRDAHMFDTYSRINKKVAVADGHEIRAKGVGKLRLPIRGHTIELEATHVPALSANLLSVGKLTEAGYEVTFSHKTLATSNNKEPSSQTSPFAAVHTHFQQTLRKYVTSHQ